MKYVLLVEDEKNIAEIIGLVLEHAQYRVRWAPDLKHAYQLFDAEKPVLILLDYYLEDGTPEKFVEYVRSKDHCPIVLVTAASNSEAIAEALRIKDLLKKPFSLEELVGMIRSHVARNDHAMPGFF